MINVGMGNKNGFFYVSRIGDNLSENFQHFILITSITAIYKQIIVLTFYDEYQKTNTFQIPSEFTELEIADIAMKN